MVASIKTEVSSVKVPENRASPALFKSKVSIRTGLSFCPCGTTVPSR
jgi:hypothetical protein